MAYTAVGGSQPGPRAAAANSTLSGRDAVRPVRYTTIRPTADDSQDFIGHDRMEKTHPFTTPRSTMLTSAFTAHTSRPPNEVFAYLADLANQPEWRHDINSSELDQGAPGQPGSTWRQEVRTGPLPRPHQRVVELAVVEPDIHIEVRTIDDALLQATASYDLNADETGTAITVTTSLTATRPAGRAVLRVIRGHVAATTRQYRDQLERVLGNHQAV